MVYQQMQIDCKRVTPHVVTRRVKQSILAANSCDATNGTPTAAGGLCRIRLSRSIQTEFLFAKFDVGGFRFANSSWRYKGNTNMSSFIGVADLRQSHRN